MTTDEWSSQKWMPFSFYTQKQTAQRICLSNNKKKNTEVWSSQKWRPFKFYDQILNSK